MFLKMDASLINVVCKICIKNIVRISHQVVSSEICFQNVHKYDFEQTIDVYSVWNNCFGTTNV